MILTKTWKIIFSASAAFAVMFGIGTVCHADVTPPVAIVLTTTPGIPGADYFSFNDPVLNASGRVAFDAALFGTSSNGIFANTSGTVQPIGYQGSAAPGGGNYVNLVTPVLNSSGRVAFQSSVTPGLSGIFAGLPSSLQLIARQGNAAPGGGSYNTFSDPALNDAGQLAFLASLTGGTSSEGIFAGPSGSLQAVARVGSAAPSGGNYSDLNSPMLNNLGQVAFRSALTGGSSSSGLFAGTPGGVQTVALVGSPAPAGGNYNSFNLPVLNNAGQLAFSATLTGGTSSAGIFVGAPGSVQTVALQGTPSPAGVNFSGLSNPSINATGQVAFRASLIGASPNQGIFVGVPGSLQTVALQGTPAPETTGNFLSLSTSIAINNTGLVAFTSNLTGPGIASGNDVVLYAGSPGMGNLRKIVQEGDLIDVDPGVGIDLRTISGVNGITFTAGADNLGMIFNDDGLLVYELSFTDFSSGVFTSRIEAIPEPGSVAILVLAAGIICLGKPHRYLSRNRKDQRDSRLAS